MALIPGNIQKLNDIEIAALKIHSEALMTKFGANINALIDAKDVQTFTANGSYTVPENITLILIQIVGGGGGGEIKPNLASTLNPVSEISIVTAPRIKSRVLFVN